MHSSRPTSTTRRAWRRHFPVGTGSISGACWAGPSTGYAWKSCRTGMNPSGSSCWLNHPGSIATDGETRQLYPGPEPAFALLFFILLRFAAFLLSRRPFAEPVPARLFQREPRPDRTCPDSVRLAALDDRPPLGLSGRRLPCLSSSSPADLARL